jgi:hypothetical protein
MDSILVADMNRHIFTKDYHHPHHHPNNNKQPLPRQQPPLLLGPQQQQQQQQFVVAGGFFHPAQPLGLPSSGLEKRPTFDNIDKRSSWSHDPHAAAVAATNTSSSSAQFLNRHSQ